MTENERVKCPKCGKDLGRVNLNKMYLCKDCNFRFYLKRRQKNVLDYLTDGVPGVYNSRTENSKDYWETPPYFFELLNEEFQFTLDPAASDQNHKCKKYFTEKENGLEQSWAGESVFCNPPYDNKEVWMAKCYYEGKQPKTKVVLLIPDSMETEAFHEYCMKAFEIRAVKGRIQFHINGKEIKGSTNNRPSLLVIFKKHSFKWPRLRPFYHLKKDLLIINNTKITDGWGSK